jgi:NhaP-type Na+/H+ or K+/H+ antiporter
MIGIITATLATAFSSVGGNGEISITSEYVIPIFLAMIFAAALFSSRTKVPHTIVLVGFGIIISFLGFAGLEIVKIEHFKIDPNLLIDFVIPPLIFEAMMNVDYKHFKAVRISALLLATVGVLLATLVGGFIMTYIAGLPLLVAFAFAALIAPTDVMPKDKILLSVVHKRQIIFEIYTDIESFSCNSGVPKGWIYIHLCFRSWKDNSTRFWSILVIQTF